MLAGRTVATSAAMALRCRQMHAFATRVISNAVGGTGSCR
jgi:hypothetical protein